MRESPSTLFLLGSLLVACGSNDANPAASPFDSGTDVLAETAPPPPSVEHPNFVFFLGEARGWTSTSVLEDEELATSKSAVFQTPNLATIAAEGMTFSDFYAPSPRCMPSRASYFTGKSPAALHMTFVGEGAKDGAPTGNVIPPDPILDLPTSEVTIAALLKKAGYATAHFGKWHAGNTNPSAYGFDESDGATTNKGPAGELHPNPAQAFSTADRGMAFMAKSVAAGKPFYLQISHYGGGDQVDSTPESYAAENARIGATNPKDVADAAIIRDMDLAVGQVLKKIDELGVTGTTYVIFSADHGRAGSAANLPLAEGKGSIWEGGVRVPLLVRGPGIAKGAHSHVRATQVDLFPTLAELAHVSDPLPSGLEGGSLWPVLPTGSGAVKRSREEFIVHFPHYDKDPIGPASSILLGDYKLIHAYEDDSFHLYDLSKDLGEKTDLAGTMPDKVAELSKLLSAYLTAVKAQLPGHK